MIGSPNELDTEFYGMDIDVDGNMLAVGGLSDPAMIVDTDGN